MQRALTELGVGFTAGVAGTGVVARLGDGGHPHVALRADMDALQMPDGSNLHACGHDAHMAMLLGAARLLKLRERELPAGTVTLLFQPAEEGGAGAVAMMEAGAVEGVSALFALHVSPFAEHPTGTLTSRAGTVLAASTAWRVRFTGRGGHAAVQHVNVDPVPAAAAAVLALQTLVSRETSALDAAVISVTLLRAGTDGAYNVAPGEADIGGTLRALQDDTFVRLQARLGELVRHVAAAHGCNASISFAPDGRPQPYPPTVNGAAAWAFARRAAAGVLGAAAVRELPTPLMAAEDFSFYSRRVPHTAMMLLGSYNASAGATHALHSPSFTLDEAALPLGAAVHAVLALSFLQAGGAMSS